MSSPFTTKYNHLRPFTKDGNIQKELQFYTNNKFKFRDLDYQQICVPSEDIQITRWEEYIRQSHKKGVYQVLKSVFIPFQFPIQKGISQLPSYKAATLRGQSPKFIQEAIGLILKQPNGLQLSIYDSIAGKIPVLVVDNAEDFETIICALAYKNEPVNIPYSMGASIIRGLNNWAQIHKLRDEWKEENPHGNWPLFFREAILPHKSLYQDKLIVLSKKPYSGVTAETLGLSSEEWTEFSLQIRLEHECTHYFTLSHLGGMYTHLHDELVADYMGITKVLGYFDSEWFLTFMGLEGENYKKGSRMENYLVQSGLSRRAIFVLEDILRSASKNLAAFSQETKAQDHQRHRIAQLIALSSLGLDELASEKANPQLISIYRRITENFPTHG